MRKSILDNGSDDPLPICIQNLFFQGLYKKGVTLNLNKKTVPAKKVIINQTFKVSNNPKEKCTTESNDNNLIENLKTSFDLAKISFNDELARSEKLDNKFNFLLVFIAGLIAAFNIIFPYSDNISKCELLITNVIVSFFMASILSSCILIFIGMMPRSHHAIDETVFTDMDFHLKDPKNVVGEYIYGLATSRKERHAINQKKAKILKAAFVLSTVSGFFFCLLLAIKIF